MKKKPAPRKRLEARLMKEVKSIIFELHYQGYSLQEIVDILSLNPSRTRIYNIIKCNT